MKNLLIILAILAAIAFAAVQAVAWGPHGRMNHSSRWNGGYGYSGYGNNDALRQQLHQKIAEYDAVVNQPNPDSERARGLSQEISELRQQIRAGYQNREFNNHQAYHGNGQYCGWNHGGWNHGYCW